MKRYKKNLSSFLKKKCALKTIEIGYVSGIALSITMLVIFHTCPIVISYQCYLSWSHGFLCNGVFHARLPKKDLYLKKISKQVNIQCNQIHYES